MMEEKKKEIREFLAKYIRCQLKDTDNIFELGLMNSLFAMQLVTFLEKHFQIVIENEDLEIANFCSVEAMVEMIQRKEQLASASAKTEKD
jgi:methoxymalonate biosynthesis acyl carrier protein